MNTFLLFILFFFAKSIFYPVVDFKSEQKNFPRVSNAYAEKESIIRTELENNNISIEKLNILLLIFKEEKEIELWAKKKSDSKYKKIKSFAICATSGELGPKRKAGDGQTPEGFYHIERFNPTSNFYLSLGINYPNQSDKILSRNLNPGGDIFIHGNCVTIGCVPITDDKIKELYVYAVEAKNNGQKNIPVYIFPAKLNNDNFEKMKSHYPANMADFWHNLKVGYDLFMKNQIELKIQVNTDGKYSFK